MPDPVGPVIRTDAFESASFSISLRIAVFTLWVPTDDTKIMPGPSDFEALVPVCIAIGILVSSDLFQISS